MANNEEFDDDTDQTGDGSDPHQDAVRSLPLTLLEEVMGAQGIRETSDRKGYCLVLQAPSPDWVVPIFKAVKQLGEWDWFVHRTAVNRNTQDDTSERVVEALAGGGRVFGVSHQLSELLPASMLAAADKTVILPAISGVVISKVIEGVTGSLPIDVPTDLGKGLTFHSIVSCIRRKSTAAECIDRLRKASKSNKAFVTLRDDTPPISALYGMGPAKTWALELIDDLEAWRRGEIRFEDISSAAAIIAGPPGVGKTAFMKSLAKSAGLPLIATSVGEWFASSPGYLDSIIKKIDETFAAARAVAPAIIFLDEPDFVPSRATISPRGADWWLPVITHLLTTLDGAVSGKTEKLVVVGATNHPLRIDSALVRSGRFDRILQVDLPDEEALVGIFRQHLGQDLAGADLTDAARLANGATGAAVVAWARAARRRSRLVKRPMLMADLLAAIAPPEDRNPELVWRIAIHEAGHAVAAHEIGLGGVKAISIVSNGMKGGYTQVDHNGRAPTRFEMERMVVQTLAGRAAEDVIFLGDIGTGSGGGPTSDLATATRSIGLLHLGTGLGGNLLYLAGLEEVPLVLATNPVIAQEVEKELRHLYAKAVALIRNNQHKVEALARELVERRHIGAEEFLEIMAEHQDVPLPKEVGNG